MIRPSIWIEPGMRPPALRHEELACERQPIERREVHLLRNWSPEPGGVAIVGVGLGQANLAAGEVDNSQQRRLIGARSDKCRIIPADGEIGKHGFRLWEGPAHSGSSIDQRNLPRVPILAIVDHQQLVLPRLGG